MHGLSLNRTEILHTWFLDHTEFKIIRNSCFAAQHHQFFETPSSVKNPRKRQKKSMHLLTWTIYTGDKQKRTKGQWEHHIQKAQPKQIPYVHWPEYCQQNMYKAHTEKHSKYQPWWVKITRINGKIAGWIERRNREGVKRNSAKNTCESKPQRKGNMGKVQSSIQHPAKTTYRHKLKRS